MRIVRRLSSPARPSLPQIPCITHPDDSQLGPSQIVNQNNKRLAGLEILQAKPPPLDQRGESTNEENGTGRTSLKMPLERANGSNSIKSGSRKSSLKNNSLARCLDEQTHPTEAPHTRQLGQGESQRICTKRPTSYGGTAKRHEPPKIWRYEAEIRAAAANANSHANTNRGKRRFSLTSGSFAHQFPRGSDGFLGGDLGQVEGTESGANGPGGVGGGENPNKGTPAPGPAVSDVIGSFGLFQLLVLLFSGLRECLVGYDALIMSVILQPETKFLCADNLPHTHHNRRLESLRLKQQNAQNSTAAGKTFSSVEEFNDLIQLENYYFDSNLSKLSYSENQSSTAYQPIQWNETAQCFRSLDGGRTALLSEIDGRPLECQSWIFANETARLGPSLVAEWSLVCQYHWLVAFVESAFFLGLVTGNLTWGYYADKVGRRPAYLTAHTISLVFGSLAVFMPSIYLFALCRFLSAFGSVGYNIIYSIQVELIGAKHRSFSTILNHLGWGLGVICVPLVDHLFDDYRPIIAVAPLLSLFMFPWAFWLPESSRWLMANGLYDEARRELIRAAKFNGKKITPKLEKKIWALEQKVRFDKLQQLSNETISNGKEAKRSYRLIFTTPKLLRDTLILAYLAFVGHLFYYVQTINFAYVKNLSTEANFITSGAGEWVSVVVGAILLKFCTRKTCMSLFLAIMAGSFAFQSLIDSDVIPELDTVPIITTNNGLGTLSSLLLIFIALIVNQEVYPTVVRQTGTSITNTVGEMGSTLAPLVIQLSRILGLWEANVTNALMCLLGILFTQFLTRTDDIELPDT